MSSDPGDEERAEELPRRAGRGAGTSRRERVDVRVKREQSSEGLDRRDEAGRGAPFPGARAEVAARRRREAGSAAAPGERPESARTATPSAAYAGGPARAKRSPKSSSSALSTPAPGGRSSAPGPATPSARGKTHSVTLRALVSTRSPVRVAAARQRTGRLMPGGRSEAPMTSGGRGRRPPQRRRAGGRSGGRGGRSSEPSIPRAPRASSRPRAQPSPKRPLRLEHDPKTDVRVA